MAHWLPKKREIPGALLAIAIAGVASALVRIAPSSPYVSDIIIAIVVGAIIVNTPLRHILGWRDTGPDEHHRYDDGLRYIGKTVLRLAIILMGLKVQIDLFRIDQVLIIGVVLLFVLPTAFFVTHVVSAMLGLRRDMADLLSIGTMVCGASAISALVPAINARHQDQGLAITAVFIFTVFALLSFYPVATGLGLSYEYSGLWSGLAVNDLAGSVAVGVQFGENAALIAAAAKSVRVVLLGPLVIGFSIMRSVKSPGSKSSLVAQISSYLPLFIVGYFVCFGLRVCGDLMFGPAAAWLFFLLLVNYVVKVAILSVCAGIGLHIKINVIIEVGWKATVAGGAASMVMAGLSLLMLFTFANATAGLAVVEGMLAVCLGWLVYRSQERVPQGPHHELSH